MWPGNLTRCIIESGSRIPTDKVKGIKRGSEGFLKELIDGEWKFREDALKEGKTSLRIQKDKSGLPEKEVKKRKRYPTPTKEILHKAKGLYPQGEGIRVLKCLYRQSEYKRVSDNPYYSGTSTRPGRYFSYSQEQVGKRLGIRRMTISLWLTRFKADGFVCVRKQGYPGRGNAILELALNEAHRRILKRITRERE